MRPTRAGKPILVTATAAAVAVLALWAASPYYSGALLKAVTEDDTMSAVVQVRGMTCDHCALRVRDAIVKVPGVKAAEVSYRKGEAVVVYDPGATNPDAVHSAVDAAGFEAGEVIPETARAARAKLVTASVVVEGLDDGAQAAAVRHSLGKLKGVSSAEVSPEKSEATVIDLKGESPGERSVGRREVKVLYDPALLGPERITAAIEAAGFDWAESTFIPPQ